jgi:hypothetical protein
MDKLKGGDKKTRNENHSEVSLDEKLNALKSKFQK